MSDLTENKLACAVAHLGGTVLAPLQEMGRMAIFLLRALVVMVVPPLKFGRLIKRVQFIGFQSLIVILLTGLFTGMVLGYQGYNTLHRVGSTAFVGPMVAFSLLRELGPVLTALMVTARAGSAICAEIGIMRLNEEIDALELMGLNPYRYHIVPVLLGTVLCMPLLTAVFDAIGIGGGYLVAVKLLGVSGGTYFGEMADYLEMKDVMGSLYKSLAFGGLVAWICTYKGFYTGYGAEGVSRATTSAVVLSSVLILVSDYFLTSILF